MPVQVNKELCVGCAQCEPVCPEKAVRVWGVAEIDIGLCTDCLTCFGYCPVKGALEEVQNGE